MVVSQICTYIHIHTLVKTYQSVIFKYVQFTLYQLYRSKSIKILKASVTQLNLYMYKNYKCHKM